MPVSRNRRLPNSKRVYLQPVAENIVTKEGNLGQKIKVVRKARVIHHNGSPRVHRKQK